MSAELEKIKEVVTMFDLVQRYGIDVNAAGFAQCPFHQEKTPSMKIYERGYKCFGCNSGGSIFDMVMKMFNLNFKDAKERINHDFGLVTSITVKENQEWERKKKARDKAKKEREDLLKEWLWCKKIIEIKAPIQFLEEVIIFDDWVQAINKIDRLEYELGLI
jgi:DNA primase